MRYLLFLLPSLCYANIPDEAIRTTSPVSICTTSTSTLRDVPERVKKQVFIRDGGDLSRSGDYEVDHRVSLTVGGSNDITNLKLQSYNGKCNAHHKDKLEVRLHSLICKRTITVSESQEYLYNNWEEGYKRFINPLGCNQ